MPDVERSDSVRSDGGTHKPRVSFNRDVHVKRIGPRGVQASPNGSPKAAVRKQRLGQVSDEVLAREAARVVRQADSVHCKATPPPPDKFLTLPLRKKNTHHNNSSVGRSNSLKTNKPRVTRSSIFNIFKRPDVTSSDHRSPVGRSKSDVSDRRHAEVTQHRKRTGSESEEYLDSAKDKKKQLSPIIETSPREDYFGKNNPLDVVDGLVKSDTKEDHNTKKTKSKDNINSVAKKLKVDKTKANKINDKENINPEPTETTNADKVTSSNVADTIKETINILGNSTAQEKSEDMIHSSQKPTEKLPLTKGHTVDHLVKKLSNEKPAPLPYTNLLITPGTVQHNNNQPFSYTRPSISPDPNMYNHHSDHNVSRLPSQIIYAQVVCNNDSNGMNKQTVHTSFTKPRNNSDEDEGLGYEESTKANTDRFSQIEDPYKSLSDYNADIDLPITPMLREFRNEVYNKESYTRGYDEYKRNRSELLDLPARGMADGMDSKRKESLTEPHLYSTNINDLTDLSHRRDLLQSRINSRKLADLNHLESQEKLFKSYSPIRDEPSPLTTKFVTETKSKYYRESGKSPVGFTEKTVSKTHIDDDGIPYTTKSHSRSDWPHRELDVNRKLFLDSQLNGEAYGDTYSPTFNYTDSNEPRSFDSQISDYLSSTEQRNVHREEKHIERFTSHSSKYSKDDVFAQNRDHYRSNPEIVQRKDYVQDSLESPRRPETYHNSLRRQNKEERVKSRYNYGDNLESTPKTSRLENGFGHFDTDHERKDRLVDSGIENDYRKDSNGEIDLKNSSERRYLHKRNLIGNESDEDINAPLRERRHTENDLSYRRDVDYEYGYRTGDSYERKEIRRYGSDEEYKYFDNKGYKPKKRDEYVHRERSIDDGSLYDPRIDKITDKKTTTLRKDTIVDKKPPREDKKLSSLEKVKQLFSRDSSKKQKKGKVEPMVKEEDLRARYTEYKGSAENLEDQIVDRVEKKRGAFKSSRESRIDEQLTDYGSRRRLSTPSASPSPPRRDKVTRNVETNQQTASNKPLGGSWFKSLDRLARRGKTRAKSKDTLLDASTPPKYPQSSSSGGSRNASRLASRHNSSPLPGVTRGPTPQKNLRFFGDTDLESNASISKHKTSLKSRPLLNRTNNNGKHYSSTQALSSVDKDRKRVSSMSSLHNDQTDGRQNLLLNSYNQEKFSNRNLHNISEIHSLSETESHLEEPMVKKGFRYRYNSRENIKANHGDSNDSRLAKKPPMGPLKEDRKNDKYTVNTRDTLSKMRKSKSDLSDGDYRRKRADIIGGTSSVESSTEGDSSQQSQHSIVYLHAATVGDIPGPRRRNRRSASREELSSVSSSRLQPQVKTISRSISVLAPWKPRHIREGYDINYSQMQNNLTNGRSKSKLHNSSISSQDSSQKMKIRNGNHDSATMGRRSKYENNEKKSSNNALYRKNRDRNSHESLSDRKQSKSKTLDRSKIDKHNRSGSVEALSANNRMREDKIARSISMPRDPSKSAGWFKMTKKNKK